MAGQTRPNQIDIVIARPWHSIRFAKGAALISHSEKVCMARGDSKRWNRVSTTDTLSSLVSRNWDGGRLWNGGTT